jgi:hypothetical protein
MTLSPHMLAKAMIDRAGKKWNTVPERNFNQYQISRGLGLMMNQNVSLLAVNRMGILQAFDFQCDFLRPKDFASYARTGYHDPAKGFDRDYEIDGAGHSEKNDPWKDSVKVAHGITPIHIPGSLTKPHYWPVLDDCLREMKVEPDGTVYLDRYSR